MARILVADDDMLVRWSLVSTLEKDGHKVDWVNSGDEAIAKIRSKNFDYIITDLIMPGIKSIELIEKMKELADLSKVIVITGFGSREIEKDLRGRGVLEYFEKPFKIDMIKSLIR